MFMNLVVIYRTIFPPFSPLFTTTTIYTMVHKRICLSSWDSITHNLWLSSASVISGECTYRFIDAVLGTIMTSLSADGQINWMGLSSALQRNLRYNSWRMWIPLENDDDYLWSWWQSSERAEILLFPFWLRLLLTDGSFVAGIQPGKKIKILAATRK